MLAMKKKSYCSRVRNAAKLIAADYELCPNAVCEAAVSLQAEERDSLAELIAARRAARKATGLTLEKISRLEDAGCDYSHVSGLDADARELARLYPVLGMGNGYASAEQHTQTNDYAARLWEMLREADPVVRAQHDLSLVREAAEIVHASVACPF